MLDFSADIPVFLDTFGEPVTFLSSGNFFTVHGIYAVTEDAIAPMDGERAKAEYTVTCAAADVADVTPLYTAIIRNVEHRILAVTPNPITGMTEILLGRP